MVEIRKPLPVGEAVQKVMNYRFAGKKEKISIHDSDFRRLAEPIIATNNVPSFDKSPYDGFALRSVDTENASRDNPIEFEVVEHIGAGQVPLKKLATGQATRIMTGAKIPAGADCVAMFEVCKAYEVDGQPFMSIKRKMEVNQNVMHEGSEVKQGEKLIDAGTMINPGVKAVMATFGYHEVQVAKQPIIGVIATGTELLDVDEKLEPGKIRNSNAYMIASQIKQAGAQYKYFGKMADEFDPSYALIEQALEEVDILITTGGVSVGDFDLMPAIFAELGAEVLFNKVAMRPGSVTTVAVRDGQLLFGLSGNPSACYVGFELFTRPVIQHALFNSKPFLRRIQATLADEFPKPNPFMRFVRSYVTYDHGEVKLKLSGIDQSNVVTSLAHATALMVLPGGTRGYDKGDQVEALLLTESEGQQAF